jgi:hypothetical protein
LGNQVQNIVASFICQLNLAVEFVFGNSSGVSVLQSQFLAAGFQVWQFLKSAFWARSVFGGKV